MADPSVEEKEASSEVQNEEGAKPASPSRGKAVPAKRKHRVLVVDDEEKFLKVVLKILPAAGCKVEVSKDPEKALEMLDAKEPYALLITDNRMPGMRGTELLQKCRQVSPTTVRMLATAFFDTQLISDVVNRSETYRYIKKPVDFKLFIKLVQESLRKYEEDEGVQAQINKSTKLEDLNEKAKVEAESLRETIQKLKKSLRVLVFGILFVMAAGAGGYGINAYLENQEMAATSKKMGSWILYKDRTALDTESNLIWMTLDFRNIEKRMPKNWNEAMAWPKKINKKGFAGFKDWRVPTIEEYRQTYDPEHTKVAYDQREDYRVGYPKAFQNGGGYGFWSSDSTGPANARYFFFIGGYDKTVDRGFQNPTMSVRLVRTPQ